MTSQTSMILHWTQWMKWWIGDATKVVSHTQIHIYKCMYINLMEMWLLWQEKEKENH